MVAKKDDRVRRLAGGSPHMDVALSTAVGRQLGAQVHNCKLYAVQAVIEGYADVYVEGVHYNPLGNYYPLSRAPPFPLLPSQSCSSLSSM